VTEQQQRVEERRCSQQTCRRTNVKPGFKTCTTCLQRQRNRRNRRRDKRLCQDCAMPLAKGEKRVSC
jgi:hypothetical protein